MTFCANKKFGQILSSLWPNFYKVFNLLKTNNTVNFIAKLLIGILYQVLRLL
ncbi:hypothetical protein J655_1000 [Acinetobacter sp. 1294243]|nr:hypothetical protein J655_1000 [Acinetobacter sp. 1294243]